MHSTKIFLVFAMLWSSLGLASALSDLAKQNALVFRFTGTQARSLSAFLKEYTAEPAEKSEVDYVGNLKSLACKREGEECLLWLTQKEWEAREQLSTLEETLTLSFTLDYQTNALAGELRISQRADAEDYAFNLALSDSVQEEGLSFSEALLCPIISGPAIRESLKGDGDCRLDLLGPREKKVLDYHPSLQFIRNSSSIALVLDGPWAEQLFRMNEPGEADPESGGRKRVSLGPDIFCWAFPVPATRPFICQILFKKSPNADLSFSAQSNPTTKPSFSLHLTPGFDSNLLQRLDLTYHSSGQTQTIKTCAVAAPYEVENRCVLYYDLFNDVSGYPLGQPTQGIAVGWGVQSGGQGADSGAKN
jgi:hypothetical protein